MSRSASRDKNDNKRGKIPQRNNIVVIYHKKKTKQKLKHILIADNRRGKNYLLVRNACKSQ